jgi:3-dehydroquinate dehydratase-2
MVKILVIHGPNLNLQGYREVNIYGTLTLSEIDRDLRALARKSGAEVDTYQSNQEGQIVDRLHAAPGHYHAVVLNAGALTHYSIALRDAIGAITAPVVEVHLSNIYAREPFQHVSIIGPMVAGQIAGFGKHSYLLGLRAALAIAGSTNGTREGSAKNGGHRFVGSEGGRRRR